MSAKDLALVPLATAPSPAASGTTFKVLLTEINSGGGGSDPIIPTDYPFFATIAPANQRPTRDNSEIVKVTSAADDATHRTYTVTRQQGTPTTDARTIEVGDEMIVGLAVDDWEDATGPHQCARAYLSSNQLNLTNSTWTKIQLDTENYDPDSLFDNATNYRFTAEVDGYYQCNAGVGFTSVVADKVYGAAIYKNGSAYAKGLTHSASTSVVYATVADLIYLEANDYVELYGLHIAGVSTVDVIGTTDVTWMSVDLRRRA